ncbi:MAG: hypothetical protein AAFW73_05630 [Bacteroidota bacterium]
MKFHRIPFPLLLLALGFLACEDGTNEKLLLGQWQAVELVESGEPVEVDLEGVYFEFLPNERYHFQSTLRLSESGRYYTVGPLLYTTDTTAEEAIEKAVKITQLTPDSLTFLMNDRGVEKQLHLRKK